MSECGSVDARNATSFDWMPNRYGIELPAIKRRRHHYGTKQRIPSVWFQERHSAMAGVLVRNFPAHSGLAVRRITGALRHGPKRASKAASTDEHPGASDPPFIRSPRFSSRKRAGTEGLGNAAWSRTRQPFKTSPADGRHEPSAGMALVPGPAAAEIEPQRSEEPRAVTCLASVRSRVTPLPSQRVLM